MTISSQLHDLQALDLELRSNEQRRAEITSQLGDSREVARARQRLDALEQRLEEEIKELHSAEWAADDLSTKLAKVDETLYSGRVRNPKELEDFQADLTSLRGQLSRREDTLLEVMLEREDAEAGLRQAEATLAEVEESWKAQQTSLQETQATLKEEIGVLEAKRTGQVDGMDAAALSLYQALRERREGTAVAVVERGLCQGCRISLPISIVQKARAGAGLVKCVSCERILLVS